MSKISDKSLLLSFNKYKTYDDEEFRFLVFPYVNKYEYVISNYGKLFKFSSEKEKAQYPDKDGYFKSSIRVLQPDGKYVFHTYFIHRMVAYTFCKKDPDRNLVNHIDGNKQNNYYKNLEWVTPAENTRHAILHGLQYNSGVHCPSAIYSEETIRKICSMLESGYDCLEIYKELTNDEYITNRAIYALIFSIKTGKRHREIASEYNIPDYVTSKTRTKFTKDETDRITELILEGKRPIEILHEFGINKFASKEGRRLSDKIRLMKKHSIKFND